MARTDGQWHLTMARQQLPLSSWVRFGASYSPVPVSVQPAPSLQAEKYMVFLVKKH